MKIHAFLALAVVLALSCQPEEPQSGTTTVADTGATIAVTEPSNSPSDIGPGVEGVQLAAELSGKSVKLTLRNQSAQPIGYNLCLSALEKLDGGSWVNTPTDTICTMQLNSLQPAGTATFDHQLPATLSPGQYRFVTNVEAPAGTPQALVASNPFTVS